MIRIYLLCLSYVFMSLAAPFIAGAEGQAGIWKNMTNGISDSNVRIVEVNPANPRVLYAASLSTIYKSADSGITWEEILSLRATGNRIRSMAIAPSETETVYAGTDRGLYQQSPGTRGWEKVFTGVGEEEKTVLSIAVNPEDPDMILIGTRGGLFLTGNRGKEWQKSHGLPSGFSIYAVAIDHSSTRRIYAASDRGLYKSVDRGKSWRKILKTDSSPEESLNGNDEEGDENDEVQNETNIQSIAIDPREENTLYVSTLQGLFVSRDGGDSWERLSSLGLGSPGLRQVVPSGSGNENLYAATDRGVFRFSGSAQVWEELYKGMGTADIRYLAAYPHEKEDGLILWAATGSGLYRTIVDTHAASPLRIVDDASREDSKMALSMFAHEPSINEIRKAAIIYAEVQKDKIEGWRKAASYQAWLPDVRFSYDKGRDWQNSDYFYSTTSEKYKDIDTTNGRDEGWSISLSWELGDLIWNSDQTSIDSRSRLMVQLRDDVINEVTRIYFERRRLQVDLFMSPPQAPEERLDKELRLQELTANIDALTDSYLSERLAQVGVRAQRQD